MPISTKQCEQLFPALANTMRSWLICATVDANNSRNDCTHQALGSALGASNGEIYGILTSCNHNPLQIYTNLYALRDWILLQTGDWVRK